MGPAQHPTVRAGPRRAAAAPRAAGDAHRNGVPFTSLNEEYAVIYEPTFSGDRAVWLSTR